MVVAGGLAVPEARAVGPAVRAARAVGPVDRVGAATAVAVAAAVGATGIRTSRTGSWRSVASPR